MTHHIGFYDKQTKESIVYFEGYPESMWYRFLDAEHFYTDVSGNDQYVFKSAIEITNIINVMETYSVIVNSYSNESFIETFTEIRSWLKNNQSGEIKIQFYNNDLITGKKENYEKLAINQVVYELAAQRLCSSKEAEDLYNFDDYSNWLADLTNTTGGRAKYAYALYAVNMWSHKIKETEFKLEAQHVMYQLIKYTDRIFLGK
jgi:hypothetical protein